MRKWVKYSLIAGGALAVLVVVGVGFLAWSTKTYMDQLPNHFDDRTFDRDLWLKSSGSTEPDNPRGQMYEALVAKLESARPSRNAVLELLGRPDFKEEPALLSYNLGMWSGFRIDYDSLDIRFDAAGNFVSVGRVQH